MHAPTIKNLMSLVGATTGRPQEKAASAAFCDFMDCYAFRQLPQYPLR